ncbi:MAG TPA: asparagine synthase (glutamine-hydrolyzing) [Ignavibacteria bacterium]|nr:asparagine synthase (glutamine-hydrolyzing) [Ignavibacteria bacterium]
MCGINGILYFENFKKDESLSFFENNISVMNEEIAHRGPDGNGMFISYPVCLGHRRLSIIDLSEEAGQPMFNEDKSVVIVFNGEIYNYKELLSELTDKGHVFKTKSDTEVILHSYTEFGFDCVSRFNGMWAFTIYDIKKKILFASRDRFGVKPFYYYKDDRQFIFSSEIKAVLKIKNITESNHGKVFDYLAYGYKTSNGDTFFKDINELKPAHNIIIQNDKAVIKKYWDFKDEKYPGNDIKEKLNYLLYDSVKLRFRSDVPVSILLSGGLDSGIITRITDELIDDHQLKENEVTAFSAVFPGFMYDESKTVKEFIQTCRHIRSVEITPGNDNLLTSINNFVYGMGEPVFSTTSFAHYILMKEIKKNNVKVVMNGQGSDEAWCGYGRYFIGYFLLDILVSRPQEFISQMNSISDKMKYSYKFILLQTLKAVISRRYSSYLRAKYKENIIDCLSFDFFRKNYKYISNPEYNKLAPENLSGYMKYNIQFQGFNQILHYEDHSSMQSSIEMRSPFIDYRLMELAFSLNDKVKFDNGVTKKIFRELFKDKLPQSVINNHMKIGFMTPFDNWMDQEKTMSFLNELLNSDSFRSKRIFDPGKIREKFRNRNSNRDFPFWRLINLELWSQAYGIRNL